MTPAQIQEARAQMTTDEIADKKAQMDKVFDLAIKLRRQVDAEELPEEGENLLDQLVFSDGSDLADAIGSYAAAL